MYSYITNNCLSTGIYRHFNREYDNPFVACLFVNDEQYVRFCKNFDHYINVEPKFGEPKPNSVFATQTGQPWYQHEIISIPYPVMYLEDIEIHWIHHEQEKCLSDYMRRRQRYFDYVEKYNLKPMFLLSGSDFLNDHTPEGYNKLVQDFISIPTSIYLTRYPEDLKIDSNRVILHDPWVGSNDERDVSNLYKFTNINHVSTNFKYILQYIKPVPLQVNLFVLSEPNNSPHTDTLIKYCDYNSTIIDHKYNFINTIPHESNMVGQPVDTTHKFDIEKFIQGSKNVQSTLQNVFSFDKNIFIDDLEKYIDYNHSSYYPESWNINIPHSLAIPNIELVSSTHTSIDPISRLDTITRKQLFDRLFDNKVCDFHHFETNKQFIETNDSTKIFLIPSVIHIHPKNQNRSCFNSDDRLQQTYNQIQTIKKHPNCVVILLELSELSLTELEKLNSVSDFICLFSQNQQAQHFAHNDPNKNKTEVFVLYEVLKQLQDFSYSHALKFGGRYWLSPQFDIDHICKDIPVFNVIPAGFNCHNNINVIEPVIYSIPKKYMTKFLVSLVSMLQILDKQFLDVERLLYSEFAMKIDNFLNIEYSNVCGYPAHSGVYRYF